jgi:polyisoprenoid-binding protein YceI
MERIAAGLGLALAALTAHAAPETYLVDEEHTFTHYEIDHVGFSTSRGRFDKSAGKFVLDRAERSGSVDITVDVNSVSTGVPELDKILKGEGFFEADKYPRMTFRSSRMRFDGERLVAVDGDLTIRDVTRPVTLNVSTFRCAVHPTYRRQTCGADASVQIKRLEFGVSRFPKLLADDVKLLIQIEGYVPKPQ